jgi:hypothetical protein
MLERCLEVISRITTKPSTAPGCESVNSFQRLFSFYGGGWGWGFNSGIPGFTAWATSPVLLLWSFWRWRVWRSICPTWPWTIILLFSVSLVARNTVAMHKCPALSDFCVRGDLKFYAFLGLLWIIISLEFISHGQSFRHSEAAEAMAQVGPGCTVQVGGQLRHPPCDACFQVCRMQEMWGHRDVHQDLKESLGDQAVYNRTGVSTSSHWEVAVWSCDSEPMLPSRLRGQLPEWWGICRGKARGSEHSQPKSSHVGCAC